MATLGDRYDAAVTALGSAREAHEAALAALRPLRVLKDSGNASGKGLEALRRATVAYDAAFRAMQSAELDEKELGAELAGDEALLAETRRVKAQREKTLGAGR